jgi:Fis family transcriptional regulator
MRDLVLNGDNNTSKGQAGRQASQTVCLSEAVTQAMVNYFSRLEGEPATGIYQMVLAEIESPLLEAIMAYSQNNQTRAAELLGLNRGTLRKKLKQYSII